ncbi:2Fe-2S iron-sulfur cluster binding domain-containing protein [Verminephrobacter eiseniae]|uniref:2Fe-2S iron-sulfur cluster binding domain-containing protein n=1 Tax=Verminephrobacter eiseniae TaxID=364317 RepID=UPI002238CF87|nr:(2Fe-2S)-binding protein [Verminephrobacter eiseniae]MCW5233883.1 (2Fe-2S)-binding protein [Verminephrobacter eiseniae]MCW5294562.1 (2Fe-2S)-binding protein [Verminephrobacter eiseniae]MCW8184879.1 (2Fe-2S)-binding protein [Verminephrobacter eiseniae]MCW8223625.1 (2Fe-2S)-binding protein [Verminephrobacter eiseniae]MCW8234673.1 (2Fe-2S)-binding protein [Verminephrobacter eiseniae]
MSILKLMLRPKNIEVELPAGSALTDLEFELYGQETIPFGCRSGACGACLIEVVEGNAPFNERSQEEQAFLAVLGYSGDSFRLACQCRLLNNVTIRLVSQTG